MRELQNHEIEQVSGGDNPGMGPYDPPAKEPSELTKAIIRLISGNECK